MGMGAETVAGLILDVLGTFGCHRNAKVRVELTFRLIRLGAADRKPGHVIALINPRNPGCPHRMLQIQRNN